MAELIQTKPAAGTHTLRRDRFDTETPDSVQRLWEEMKPSKQSCWFVTGTQQYSIEPAHHDELFVLLSQNYTFAVSEELADFDIAKLQTKLLREFFNRDFSGVYYNESSPRPKQAGRRYNRFRDKLIAMLLEEPIEDGVTHPVEEMINKAFCADVSECQDWLSSILVDLYPTRPSLSAAIIRCIGRLDSDHTGGWGFQVIDDALKHEDVEIRDAAVGALEAWGGDDALIILRGHTDSIAWMNKYVQQVIVDLGGDT